MEKALAFGVTTADGVRVALEQGREAPVPLFRIESRPHLAGGRRAVKKTETTSTVLLKHHLKALRLSTILGECDKVAQRSATDNVDLPIAYPM